MKQLFSRRGMLAALAGLVTAAWGAVIAAGTALFVATPLRQAGREEEILVGRLEGFGPEFRAVRLRIPIQDGWYQREEQRLIYVRVPEDGALDVLSGTCTHLSCTVRWNDSANEFNCPCHDARFAPDGTVLGGPPPAPLPRIPAEVRDGDVYVRLS